MYKKLGYTFIFVEKFKNFKTSDMRESYLRREYYLRTEYYLMTEFYLRREYYFSGGGQ